MPSYVSFRRLRAETSHKINLSIGEWNAYPVRNEGAIPVHDTTPAPGVVKDRSTVRRETLARSYDNPRSKGVLVVSSMSDDQSKQKTDSPLRRVTSTRQSAPPVAGGCLTFVANQCVLDSVCHTPHGSLVSDSRFVEATTHRHQLCDRRYRLYAHRQDKRNRGPVQGLGEDLPCRQKTD